MIPIDVHIYYLAYTENNLKYSASLKENVLQDGLICKDIFNDHYLDSALFGAALSQVERCTRDNTESSSVQDCPG